jgi:hypothetical protein
MTARPNPNTRRFVWSALKGPCRRRLAAGLLLMTVAAAIAIYAGLQFSRRGGDAEGFDQPLIRAARAITAEPRHLRGFEPRNDRELYLLTVVSDQRDVLFGLTLLALRMVVTVTIGGFGLVLLTAGATEWEIRSGIPT